MRLPSFSELLDEQRQVFMEDPDKSILVVGPPGSGKTTVALWKANVLAGPEYQRQVVVVTRNRLLAALATQISQDQGNTPVSSTTMHALVWQHYRGVFGHAVPQLEAYSFNWPQILLNYESAGTTPSIDHLIVDEGQNLPQDFFVWARRFGASTVSVFADENQTTDAGGCHISDLQAAGFTDMHLLTVNHRNTLEIAELVEHFHRNRYVPSVPAQRGRSNEVPRLMTVTSWEDLAQLVSIRFGNRGGSIGVIVYRVNEIQTLHRLFRENLPDARIDSYTNYSAPSAEHAIRLREDGITIISGESAIGLEFDTVYLQDLDRSLPIVDAVQERRLYMLCARARDTLFLVNGPQPLTQAQLVDLPPSPILDR
ncbi:AAA family ATPase [Comamonas testosteroni]|uniref:AAA family ATPase n=1 Tax=Comamonas testosteroni TaxID=285 RepID=UPI002DB9128B|nr:AAA family ATPase [Comamonas testosteroni]MEB5967366.1 AAA family ATPase [Comamonas testosteroni]